MNNFRIVVALIVAAILLVAGVLGLALVDPLAAVGLPPTLLAVAAIIRAIRGGGPKS